MRLKRRFFFLAGVLLIVGLATAGALLAGSYRGNSQSRVFHASDCRHYNCKACTVEFESRDAALGKGFRPCQICKP